MTRYEIALKSLTKEITDEALLAISLENPDMRFERSAEGSLAIASSGNDYLVKVKTNQPKLYQQIETESNAVALVEMNLINASVIIFVLYHPNHAV